MTTTWNADKPAVGNQISADIPDIEENFQLIGEIFTAITDGTLGTTAAAAYKVDTLGTRPTVTTGFNDQTQNIDFPTNGMSAAKFMLGASTTIAWFYVNTAPPGWKVLTTGKDTVLGVGGGTTYYTGNGGTADGSWEVSGITTDAHTHELSVAATLTSGGAGNHLTSTDTGEASDTAISSDSTWRPSASLGKLYQLDTA